MDGWRKLGSITSESLFHPLGEGTSSGPRAAVLQRFGYFLKDEEKLLLMSKGAKVPVNPLLVQIARTRAKWV